MPGFPNISATTASFKLSGGAYGMTVHATWNAGSVTLQRLALDGLTYVSVQAFTADGFATMNLPDGTYQIAVATATGVYVDVAPVATANY